MKIYPVPPDMKEKEKVIGGVLNLNQFFWLLGGFGLGALFFILSFVTIGNGILSCFLGLIGLLSGTPFAFKKKLDMTLWQYISRKRALKRKTQKLINRRRDV